VSGRERIRLLAATACVLLCVQVGAAPADEEQAPEAPSDFAYGMDLALEGTTPFYEISLPEAVYEGSVVPGLADVRVFNAAGEVVPYGFLPRITETSTEPEAVEAPIYEMHTDAPEGVAAVDVIVQHSGGTAVIALQGPGGVDASTFASAPLVGYLVDAREIRQAVRAVELELPADRVDILTRVRLESSDDLRTWSTLASDTPVVQLVAGTHRLERRRIEFRPQRLEYLRLSWPGRVQPLEVLSLRLAPGVTKQEKPREWKVPQVVAVPDKRGRYEVDLGGHFPVDRLIFDLPQPNTVATMGIYGRPRALDPWQFITAATVYRLTDAGADVKSDPSLIGEHADRFWRFSFDPRGGGIGTGELHVRAGWVPHRLVFAARGPQPFVLAYGRRDAQSATFPVASLVPGYEDPDARTRFNIGIARPERPQTLAGERVIQEPRDWRRPVLWVVLVLAVAVLAAMAVQLARQMSGKKA
jgi:hypothetical protein